MELNRNPDNFFADVEQAAFTPANVVPGIGFSPGQDAAGPAVLLRRRAALPARRQPPPDPGQLPRAARCTATTATAPCGSTATRAAPGYEPNSYGRVAGAARLPRAGPVDRRDRRPLRLPRGRRQLLRAARRPVPPDEPASSSRCCSTTPPAPSTGARHQTVERHIANCTQADPAYGEGVRKACEALGAL